MAEGTETVRKFMAAFASRDVERIMSFFAENALYHNMPMKPARGAKEFRPIVEFFVTPAEEIEFQILSIAEAGDTILTERLDRFVIKGKTVELPIMGAFEVAGGKITAWRDYFDMQTWRNQLG